MGYKVRFRKDINGLRAVAVIAVVLFHFNPVWMPGGFAGVDVFFVISGFLMTSIIFRGIEQDNFSIVRFYAARANRIFPALAVLCLSLLVFGWFTLLDFDFDRLSKHVLSSIVFVSNIVYWRESGYFDAVSHEKWLLHTWSLSVEWQFYILYPLALVFMRKFMPIKTMRLIVLSGAVIGFAGCTVATYKWPDFAYYLLPARAWEMLIGGVAYLYPLRVREASKKYFEWAGLLLILGSYFFVSKESPWPGYLALFPVFGAFLLIQSQRYDSLITGNIVFQKIGTWSYSIYLWHWPLVVYLNNNYPSDTEIIVIIMVALSVFLGFASNHYVESNVRGLRSLLLLSFVTATLPVTVLSSKGYFSNRDASNDSRSDILKRYADYKMDPEGWFGDCNAKNRLALTGEPNVKSRCISSKYKEGVFLWGDSHIGSIVPGIRNIVPEKIPVYQLTSSGCSPSFIMKRNGFNAYDIGCDYSNEQAYKAIQRLKPRVVILGQAGGHEKMDWIHTIKALKLFGVSKIIVLGPLPQWKPSLPIVYVQRHMGQNFISDYGFDLEVLALNKFMKAKLENESSVRYIDILSKLCTFDGNLPKCQVKIDNTLIAFDYGHLTTEGSYFLAENYLIDEIRYW